MRWRPDGGRAASGATHGRHGGRRAQIRGLRRRLRRQIVRRRLRERRLGEPAHDDDERDRRRRAGRPRAHGARSRGAAAWRAGPAADAVVSATGQAFVTLRKRHNFAGALASPSRTIRSVQSSFTVPPRRRSRPALPCGRGRQSCRRSPWRSGAHPAPEGVRSGGRRSRASRTASSSAPGVAVCCFHRCQRNGTGRARSFSSRRAARRGLPGTRGATAPTCSRSRPRSSTRRR